MRLYISTLLYIFMVVLVNVGFSYVPTFTVAASLVSPMDAIVGVIYIFRDFAQREIRHYVIFAMLIGAAISYLFADRNIAVASMAAFLLGEFVDWLVFTLTNWPLSQRLIWSATLSAPVDSAAFLLCIHRFSWLGMLIMMASKFVGVLIIWLLWRRADLRRHRKFNSARSI